MVNVIICSDCTYLDILSIDMMIVAQLSALFKCLCVCFRNEPAFDVSYKIFCEQIIRQRIIVNQEVLRMNQLRRKFINLVKEHEDIDASNYR